MKNTFKLLVSVLLLACSGAAFAEDKYDQLAKELTEAGAAVQGKKIAIIPFSYADGRTGATKDGSVISERLTIKMINGHKFEVIERSVLDKVMNELKLQNSGAIDASSAQQLGKVLGVEAIITGTLVETSKGQIEVNARMIKTETAQAIGASQVTLEKNWIGDASAAPAPAPVPAQPQAYEQPYQQPYQAPAKASYQRAQRGEFQYGFFDIFMGFGSPNMQMVFANSANNITLTNSLNSANNDLGIYSNSFGTGVNYREVRFDKLTTEGFGPFAMRIGGFGNGPVGGDIEFSFEKRNIAQQTAAMSVNGAQWGNINFVTNDFATVKSFGISGDLLLRVPTKKIDPYFGIGLGLSLNTITLPYARGFTNSSTMSRPVEDFGAGFMFRVPIGMRIKAGPNFQVVTELRYEMNHVMFDRGISGEDDTITLSGAKFLIGMGFTF